MIKLTARRLLLFSWAIGNFLSHTALAKSAKLPGFSPSAYFGEQVVTFRVKPDIRIHINAPADNAFDLSKPVGLALFALPNGNTIEQTVGKKVTPKDDWHYNIQHIAAQTRFLRQKIGDYNLVTVYLETEQKSWPAWKREHANYADVVQGLIEYLRSYFRDFDPFVVLTGHSGGGRFIFSFLDAQRSIPGYVRRICFLDSNYGYEHHYGDQLREWLTASADHRLTVLAYNDSVALYNGKPVVSPTGGTWYRSRMMQRYFQKGLPFETQEDDEFIRHWALDGRIQILLKKNPNAEIFHTQQVERNGFIHTMLAGTPLENDGYQYYADRVYDAWIQDEIHEATGLMIPLRSPDAPPGSQFMESVSDLSFAEREGAILHELTSGNLPYFLRDLKTIESNFTDASGQTHQVTYRVMPDYLAVGSDEDFCRIPMGPVTAQKVADFFGACLPTRKLVDHIYQHAEIKLAPVPYKPVGDQNERVQKFVAHNQAIDSLRMAASGTLGQLTAGIKKDVVLSNKIIDPKRPNHVVIYGWHQLNGEAIQPLTNIHSDWYVDYSHGIRLLDSRMTIDGEMRDMQTVLKDSVLYQLLSDESGRMKQPTYNPSQ